MSFPSGGFDLAVSGAGPCGAVAALVAAECGLSVILLDRSEFPRHKVCGDCLNPSAVALLAQLGLREMLDALPHERVREVQIEFDGRIRFSLSLPEAEPVERVVRREVLDHALVKAAIARGVSFFPGVEVHGVEPGWRLKTTSGRVLCKRLILADGRNSSTARMLGLLPPVGRGLTGFQCHLPRPEGLAPGVVRMAFFRFGYGGIASCGEGMANLCVVARRGKEKALLEEIDGRFGVGATRWHAISPVHRADALELCKGGLFLAGDAARVVEPFTGEGIYYAMRSGQLAGSAALLDLKRPGDGVAFYRRAHAAMYGGRMLPNRLSRLAGEHPMLAGVLLRIAQFWPAPLEWLTSKVVARRE